MFFKKYNITILVMLMRFKTKMYSYDLLLQTICIIVCVSVTSSATSTCDKDYDCRLPACSCQHEDVPSGLYVTNVPPMVLFAFTGGIADVYWEKIDELFPDTITNPSGCPIAITFFVRGNYDPCTVSALYVRGHEIGTQGDGVVFWDKPVNWTAVVEHRDGMYDTAGIPEGEVVGVRAPDARPGGTEQFTVLSSAGFLYDSSLILDFTQSKYADRPHWPFTLSQRFINDSTPPCGPNDNCPDMMFPEFWEVPLGGMFLPLEYQATGHEKCQFLWQCALYAENNTIVEMLKANYKRHFSTSRNANKAPFVINVQPNIFEMENVMDDLKEFISFLREEEDAWIVTFKDAINWMQNSPDIKKAPLFGGDEEDIDQGTKVFECPKRSLARKCSSARFRNASYYSQGTSIFWLLLVFLGAFFLFALRKYYM